MHTYKYLTVCLYMNNHAYMFFSIYMYIYACMLITHTHTQTHTHTYIHIHIGKPDGNESSWDSGDPGSIPELGRLPGEENAYPLQYSCLENSMERGAWWDIVLGVKELDMTELSSMHIKNILFQRSNYDNEACNIFLMK